MADPLLDLQQLVANQIFRKQRAAAGRAVPTIRSGSLDVNVPEGMVPPSEDINAGRYFKPQQNLVQKILSSGYLGTPSDPMGMPEALATAPLGAVLNPKNTQLITGVLKRFLQRNPSASEAEVVKKFVEEKYPIFSKGAPMEVKKPSLSDIVERLVDRVKNLGGYDLYGDKKIRLTDWGEEPAKEMADTWTHELTHANQFRKHPYELWTGYLPLNTDPAKGVPYEKYFEQLWEKEARQGGATGGAAWEKFIKSITPPARLLDPNSPVTKEHVNEIMLPAILKRIAEVRGTDAEANAIAANQYRLRDAAATVTGNLNSWEKPFTVKDLYMNHAPWMDPERSEFLKKMLGNVYHGFSNTEDWIRPLPTDMRTIQEIIRDAPGSATYPNWPRLSDFQKYRGGK